MSSLLRFCVAVVLSVPTLSHSSVLENPGNGAFYSGTGVISGWKCEATSITVSIDGDAPIPMLYGSERGDTRAVCGDTPNGFVAIFNWGLLDDGEHTAVAYDNGMEFARSTFTVTTLGEEWVSGVSGECTIENFPSPGESATFEWNQNTQSLMLVEHGLSGFWRCVEKSQLPVEHLREVCTDEGIPYLCCQEYVGDITAGETDYQPYCSYTDQTGTTKVTSALTYEVWCVRR